MAGDEHELGEVAASLPVTWCPDRPLAERIKLLVDARRPFVHAFEVLHLRVQHLEAQRDAMRRGYLNLLRYGQRVAGMEITVSQLLDAAESGTIKRSHIRAVHLAREELVEVERVEVPVEALKALEPFLRGKTTRLLLTGAQLDAFREVIQWIHAQAKE